MNERTLNIKVGKLPEKNLERAVRIMESLDRGEQPEPYFAIGFASMAQFLRIFTPRRWQALAMLREQGPLTIAELAQQLQRDYKNVHGDVEKLIGPRPYEEKKPYEGHAEETAHGGKAEEEVTAG